MDAIVSIIYISSFLSQYYGKVFFLPIVLKSRLPVNKQNGIIDTLIRSTNKNGCKL